MIAILTGVLAAMTVVMTAGWLFQRAARNGGWTDVFWTYGAGVTCAAAALIQVGGQDVLWRRAFVAGLVLIWSIRLGTYVARRVGRSAEDPRYADLRQRWGDRFQPRMFWLLIVQAPITALLAVGVVLAAHRPGGAFRLWDVAGFAVLIAAILGEALADRQMKHFKQRNESRDAVCREGLWAWSRHPNYFFEALGWAAYPVIAFDSANGWSYLSIISPAMMFIVVRYLTGVPSLESAMLRSKGEVYGRYQAEVSALLPLPPHRSADPEG